MNFDIVNLEWEGPFHISYDRSKDAYNLDLIPIDLLNSYGLYQIYGRHPVYGQNVLLYIGETKNNNDIKRNFKKRLSEHVGGRFWFHTNLAVHLAPCDFDEKTILNAESILIAAHKPALNKEHIDKAKKDANNILVRSWSFLGSLQPECTGDYWFQK